VRELPVEKSAGFFVCKNSPFLGVGKQKYKKRFFAGMGKRRRTMP
jgi:hypothetical protein